MNLLFKKLGLKNQRELVVLNAPEEFNMHLSAIENEIRISRSLQAVSSVEFILVFVTSQKQVEEAVEQFGSMLAGDAMVWMCYPKGSSKKYRCEINRDKGWDIMGKYQLEGVQQVAIDDDWSALRFRKVQYIKSLSRKFAALSAEGKRKAGQE